MIDEQFEFLISQYADGTLPESERALVELRLRNDGETRALLDEFRTLDASLKHLMPLPAVHWDRLADHLSEAVADHRETRAAIVLGRIGNFGRLAIAACVVLAVGGVALWTQSKSRDRGSDAAVVITTTNNVTPAGTPIATPLVIVRGPAPQAPSSNPVVVVSVGPSANVADNWRAAEGVVTGPSRAIWIASSYEARQDTQRLPY